MPNGGDGSALAALAVKIEKDYSFVGTRLMLCFHPTLHASVQALTDLTISNSDRVEICCVIFAITETRGQSNGKVNFLKSRSKPQGPLS